MRSQNVVFPVWHICELAVADALFHHRLHGHEWGYSLVLLGSSLVTWALGLTFAQMYSIAAQTRLLRDLARDG